MHPMSIHAGTLAAALRTAIERFTDDAAKLRAAGDLRMAEAFELQAAECKELLDEVEAASGDVIVTGAWAVKLVRDVRLISCRREANANLNRGCHRE